MKIRLISSVIAVFTASIFYSNGSYAQENLATARPTSAIGAWTLPANSFQFEQGFTYVNDTLILDGLFRFAVSKIAEIRLLTTYGSNSIIFGSKIMFLDPANHKTGLAARISLYQNLKVLDFRMVITQTINDRISIFGNVGINPGGRWYGIALLNIGLGEKFATYIEGDIRGGFQQYNTGLTYLINSEMQVDFSTGWINNNSEFFGFDDSLYIGVGFARRIKYDHLIH